MTDGPVSGGEPWRSDPEVCGSCIAWRAPEPMVRADDGTPVGSCRLRPELHRVPATLGRCSLYRGRGQPAPARRPTTTSRSPRGRPRAAAAPPAPPPVARPESWTPEQVTLHEAGRAALGGDGLRPMLPRFRDGTTQVVDAAGSVITLPNEQLFAHLCRLRRSLDELEAILPVDDWKAQVQRARGSLTTFNFLFASAEDYFSGKG